MSEIKHDDHDRERHQKDQNEPERKASTGARLSILLIGVAFFSSLICMFLAILVLVRI